MRILLATLLMLAPLTRLSACSCAGPGTPCTAAGSSAAVFIGKVLDITGLSRPLPVGNIGPALASRRSGDYSRSGGSMSPSPRPLRVVRIELGEVLSGVERGQKEIEIVTGQGGGDSGYAFQIGVDYVELTFDSDTARKFISR